MSLRKTGDDRTQTNQAAGSVQNASGLDLLPFKHVLRRYPSERNHGERPKDQQRVPMASQQTIIFPQSLRNRGVVSLRNIVSQQDLGSSSGQDRFLPVKSRHSSQANRHNYPLQRSKGLYHQLPSEKRSNLIQKPELLQIDRNRFSGWLSG